LIIAGAAAVRALRLVLHVQAYEWPASSRGAKAVTVNRKLVALSRAASLAKHQHGLGGRVAPRAFCRLNGVPGGDFERAWATAPGSVKRRSARGAPAARKNRAAP
jgi:hypothetical protein